MTTKIADQYADINANMRRLGLTRDQGPQSVDAPSAAQDIVCDHRHPRLKGPFKAGDVVRCVIPDTYIKVAELLTVSAVGPGGLDLNQITRNTKLSFINYPTRNFELWHSAD